MDQRLYFPATKRNRNCIGDALEKYLPQNCTILEIASGSGEHGITFQKRFPLTTWQTSDPNPTYRKSISAWINDQGLTGKMPQPLDLAVEKKPWPLSRKLRDDLRAIVCINLLHISPWQCTYELFEEASNYLYKEGMLILYGPFKENGKHTSKSNEIFDLSLKSQNHQWGIRDLTDIRQLSLTKGFVYSDLIQMPANNLLLAFKMAK